MIYLDLTAFSNDWFFSESFTGTSCDLDPMFSRDDTFLWIFFALF